MGFSEPDARPAPIVPCEKKLAASPARGNRPKSKPKSLRIAAPYHESKGACGDAASSPSTRSGSGAFRQTLVREVEEARLEVGALNNLAVLAFRQESDPPRARRLLEEARGVAEEAALEWSIKSDGVSPKDRPRGGRLRREPDMFLSGRMGR
jgi:hypothetical protein